MLNKLKFIPLILISLFTLSFAVRIPLSSSSYDYRFRISDAGDMWLYNGLVDGVVEYCQYTQIENNAYAQPNFNESFKKDSFYAQSDPASKSPNGYFDDPATIYKFLGSETYEGSVSFKHETYSWAKKPNSIQKICVQCNTKVGEYFDSTIGLCVNKCEDITNQNDRLNCMCKRAGKIGYSGDFVTMRIFPDGPHDDHFLCNYGCETTKDDPEARPNGDYTKYSVSYDIKDTDPNANGVCFADDTYAPNATPGPNPKPDDPGNNNGTKPGGDNPKPDDPGNNNGTKPGGGGGKPDNPGNNNGTKPGNPDNNNGTKPGDDDNGKFDFGKLNELNETVEGGTNKFMKIFEDAKDQIVGAYNRLKKGKLSDFKVHGSVNSCPYTRDFVIKDGLSKKIIIDICAVVKDTRPVLYFIFYALFLFLFSLFTYKAVARLL